MTDPPWNVGSTGDTDTEGVMDGEGVTDAENVEVVTQPFAELDHCCGTYKSACQEDIMNVCAHKHAQEAMQSGPRDAQNSHTDGSTRGQAGISTGEPK